MIKVLHVCTECYPAAKAGGMGDVVGALPRYSKKQGVDASVVIPKYRMPWFETREFERVFSGSFQLGYETVAFFVERLKSKDLPFPFYCVDIPGKFDRGSIYLDTDGEGYRDEIPRNISFQRSVLDWLASQPEQFDIVHCHDHMTGLIPFFMSHGKDYSALSGTPTFFTIHNAAYRGMIHWENVRLLPEYAYEHGGLLDWDNHIHSLASALRCSWGFSTVSPSYLSEIRNSPENLSWIYHNEKEKSVGIINGIDNEMWDPKTDDLLPFNYKKGWDKFKYQNKHFLCSEYNFDESKPIITFIGRLAHQKGADILTYTIDQYLSQSDALNFVVLGSGNLSIENNILKLQSHYSANVKALIMYNEKVAHELYGGSDFIVMPSRFEPCGLNQMFAMRYGTIPIVHSTGGLIDTVEDIDQGGTGIRFDDANVGSLLFAFERARKLFEDTNAFRAVRRKCVRKNFSWDKSMKLYAEEYSKLLKIKR